MNKLKKIIKKAQNSDKGTKDLITVLLSLFFAVFVIAFWLFYVGTVFSSNKL